MRSAQDVFERDWLMLASGRVSFELVQKALMAGVPMLADLALRYGATLAGFLRDGRFNLYAGEWRISGLLEPC